jgi:hypothetical protein
MSTLTIQEQETLAAVFRRADRNISREVSAGSLHAGTALAVFVAIRDAARPLHPVFAELLVPVATEEAALAVSTKGDA